MGFADQADTKQSIRQEAASFVKMIDEIQSEKKAIADTFSAQNYVEMPGLTVFRRHLISIQDGKAAGNINISEILLLQNELHSIKAFMNNTVLICVITQDKSQDQLAAAYRNIAVKYSKMVDSLVNSQKLALSYQPSEARGFG